MITCHRLINQDARDMSVLEDQSVDLVVTSPPYPMIRMWDDLFSDLNPEVRKALADEKGNDAFEGMHRVLDAVWKEIFRLLKPGGFACINIGDAVRTIDQNFSLYTNHSRIIQAMHRVGFCSLPGILWRKQTNAPNKFMGSGMLPAGAYVTLEHEYILIFRKDGKREFKTSEQKATRKSSALFWEERNIWFSDLWMDIKGTPQAIHDPKTRKRSGAFPFELAWRLINMYSVQKDVVLDPFMGLGTTALSAMISARSSVGFEIDGQLAGEWKFLANRLISLSKEIFKRRHQAHLNFIEQHLASGKQIKHTHPVYGFPVITSQEKGIWMPEPVQARRTDSDKIEVFFKDNSICDE